MSLVLQFCVPLTSIRLDNVDSVGDHAEVVIANVGDHARVVIAKVANRAMDVA